MDREPLFGQTRSPDGKEECKRRPARPPRDYVLTAYEYPKEDAGRRERHYGVQRIYRYYSGQDRSERRHSSTAIAKVCLFCIICVSFLTLMYIPVYSKVNTKLATVSGWAADSNRDIRVYVQPRNITLVHDIKNVCPQPSKRETEPLFLLIIVCSSTVNFKERQVIRETWANYSNFLAMTKARNAAKDMYKNYKFDYDLEIDKDGNLTEKKVVKRSMGDGNDGITSYAKETKGGSLYRKTIHNDAASLQQNESERDGDNLKLIVLRKDGNSLHLKQFDNDETLHLKEMATDGEALHLRDSSNTGESLHLRDGESIHSKQSEKVQLRYRRSLSLGALIPNLAEALKKSFREEKHDKQLDPTEEVRFEDTSDQKLLPEFEMDKVLGDEKSEELDYVEESNVMKIPARGYDDSPDLSKVISLLKKSNAFMNRSDTVDDNNVVSNKFSVDVDELPVFKVLFLLGLPSADNETDVQSGIDEESNKYGDIIQESFVDSYNNLTLKSIMMLKWIVTHCDRGVRYVLKTDDDIFVNVPKLVSTISSKAEKFRAQHQVWGEDKREYYIMGCLIRNARPVSDSRNKWYAPQYMYAGRIYPRYLSGTAYVMTGTAVRPLYRAALRTPLFHLEDIFLTGMCAARATPRLQPQAEEGFSYAALRSTADVSCDLYARNTAHRVSAATMRAAVRQLTQRDAAARCERMYLQHKRVEKQDKYNQRNLILGLKKHFGNLKSLTWSIFP